MKQMKVLIAEDEPIVTRYLKRILESVGGFQVMATCESGEEALEVCRQGWPDLLITDIRMPGISGLDLIRRIREQNTNIQVVIVSAYKDFSYAKEAISLGVEDYITKPINPDELNSTLLRLKESYQKQLTEKSTLDMEQILREQNEAAFRSLFPYETCRALLVFQSGEIEELKYATVHDQCRISFFYRNSLMVLVGGEAMDKGDFSRSIEIITAAKGERKTCTIITLKTLDIRRDCFGVFQKLYRMLREQTVPGRLIIKRNFAWEEPRQPFCRDEALLKTIENQLSAKEWRTLPKQIGELFAVWEKGQCDLYHIKTVIHQITDRMYRTNSLEQSKLVINEYLDDCIRYADTYDKMRDMVCSYLEKMLKNRDTSQQEGKNADQICAEIRRYVLANENKNFSLNEICYLFKVSPPFIRKAFRQNTGMSYNEWLLDTKLQRAKELLRVNSRLRVKDVAAQLGYEQLYFSTVFNKHVGMSPSEYKALHQGEEEP